MAARTFFYEIGKITVKKGTFPIVFLGGKVSGGPLFKKLVGLGKLCRWCNNDTTFGAGPRLWFFFLNWGCRGYSIGVEFLKSGGK